MRELGGGSRTLQLIGAERVIYQREQRVHHQIGREDNAEKRRPRHIDEIEVGIHVAPGGAAAVHVERAVFVDGAADGAGVFLGQARIECRLFHNH